MNYVILRDDDTSAVTPTHVLESLYRPFLDRGLPIQLSVIPNVNTRATLPDGRPEWYLPNDPSGHPATLPIGEHRELVSYLRSNPGYGIVQHGLEHTFQEFLAADEDRARRSLSQGADLLAAAGLGRPSAFVAPQDRISPPAMRVLAERFRVVSTCWFEPRQVAASWWPAYWQRRRWRGPTGTPAPAPCSRILARCSHTPATPKRSSTRCDVRSAATASRWWSRTGGSTTAASSTTRRCSACCTTPLTGCRRLAMSASSRSTMWHAAWYRSTDAPHTQHPTHDVTTP